MSASPVALIGPPDLPKSSDDTLWCPRTLRERAWSEWRARGLPSKGVEDYLYMDWKRLESVATISEQPSAPVQETSESALINLRTTSSSAFASSEGCSVKLLGEATPEIQNEVAKELERLVDEAEHGIDLLRVALLGDAFIVEVQGETKGNLKLNLEHDGVGAITAPLVVIRVASRASLVVEDRIAGSGGEASLALPLVLVDVAESASLKQVVVSEGAAGRHVLRRQETTVNEHGNYTGFVLSASSALSREGHVLSLNGEGAHGELHGLYLARSGAYTDIWTRIEHLKPHTTSRSMFKGIVAERAESTFNGYVYVERDAQKTDSSLYNKNLLLSKRARANTRPQLEIYADDVKCAHGSTIGQLDNNQLFYLMTRGLPESSARAMLIEAFGRDVVEDCPVPEIRNILDTAISATITSMVEGA